MVARQSQNQQNKLAAITAAQLPNASDWSGDTVGQIFSHTPPVSSSTRGVQISTVESHRSNYVHISKVPP